MVAKDQAPAPNKKAKKTTRPPTGVMVFSKGLTGNRPLIDPDDIHIKPGLNCRDFTSPRMKRHVKNLAYLMLENGFDLSKALHCRYDETEKKIYLEDGESRLRAVRYAREHLGAKNLHAIPVSFDKVKDTEFQCYLRPIISNSGLRPTLVEIAFQVAKTIKNTSADLATISRHTNIEIATLQRYITIHNTLEPFPKMVQLINHGRIEVNPAIELIKEADYQHDRLEELLAQAQDIANEEKGYASLSGDPDERDDHESEMNATVKPRTKASSNAPDTSETISDAPDATDAHESPASNSEAAPSHDDEDQEESAPKIMPRHVRKAVGGAPNLGKALRDMFGIAKKTAKGAPPSRKITIQHDHQTGDVVWIMPASASRELLQAAKISEEDLQGQEPSDPENFNPEDESQEIHPDDFP